MAQITANLVGVAASNAQSPKYASAYLLGNMPPLQLLHEENFESGTLTSKTWINNQAGNENYSGIVTSPNGGTKVIRHNLFTNKTTNGGLDELTGKLCSHLNTHIYRADSFYNYVTHPKITLEMRYRYDKCRWEHTAGITYPMVKGKLFVEDTSVAQLAFYFSVDDGRLICGNTDAADLPNAIYNPADPKSWNKRSYGWRDNDGISVKNSLYFDYSVLGGLNNGCPFASDGVWRKMQLEIKYNPDGIGYHKARLRINDTIIHANFASMAAGTTDANGWFNLPIEFHLKGFRSYTADATELLGGDDMYTLPATYDGYLAGYEVDYYKTWRGNVSV